MPHLAGPMLETLTATAQILGLPTVALVGVLMGLTWIVAVVRRDASVVDAVWAVGFVLTTWQAYALTQGGGFEARRVAVFAAVTLWGLRLWLHLGIRHAQEGEDRRYATMRARWGRSFALSSLTTVFGLQGGLMLLIASPVLAVMAAPGAPAVTPWDILGGAMCAVGLVVEAVADRQLTAFRRRAEGGEAVLDTGLWRYSRHPNYFGECLFWWGLGLVAVAEGAAWALASPALLTWLLLRVSGVALMETTIPGRRPAYADYVARTSAFIPWWPRRPG